MFTVLSLKSEMHVPEHLTFWFTFSYVIIVIAGLWFFASFKFYSDYSEATRNLTIGFPSSADISILSGADIQQYTNHLVAFIWYSNRFSAKFYDLRAGSIDSVNPRYWKRIFLDRKRNPGKSFRSFIKRRRVSLFAFSYIVIAFLPFAYVFRFPPGDIVMTTYIISIPFFFMAFISRNAYKIYSLYCPQCGIKRKGEDRYCKCSRRLSNPV